MFLARSVRDFQFLRAKTPSRFGSSIAMTIGNFDGFHLGHQALFSRLTELSPPGATRVLVSFVPHPKAYFNTSGRHERLRSEAYRLLTPPRRKAELAASLGFDAFLLLRFSRRLAEMSASDFMKHIVLEGVNPQTLVVGYDWVFGKDRKGDVELLRTVGREEGIVVDVVPPFNMRCEAESPTRVSSSRVRHALSEGNLETVECLLGRPFDVVGHVVHGEKRGRQIGFPTANLHLPEQFLPKDGVYATLCEYDGLRELSVTNVGVRPTFLGRQRLVEVHILKRSGLELYGKRLRVTFVSRVRDEMKFSGIEQLKHAIQSDVASAELLLKASLSDSPQGSRDRERR
ncbi:MAG: riboflavin biosynthesis protein RibF [Deltaproteobacteria bacterium]|nr:riboflavin biosynthesis protein RibF [Deltaproteobacteria bacterium]